MPTPIIELQRRLTLVGEIRIGGEKTNPKRPGAKLSAFRLTSQDRTLIEQAATLYGGDVSSWESPKGASWQVYTETNALPVLVMPGYSLEQRYELWEGATKLSRVCDGFDEMLTGGGCICAREGVERCDIYTRLVVALPELETAQGWRLITRGANAAHELPTMMRLVEHVGSGSSFVPARLRVDERRGVKDGQVVRYVVPSLDLALGYAALAAGAPKQLARAAESVSPATSERIEAERSLALASGLGGGSAAREQKRDEYGPSAPAPEPIPGPPAPKLPEREQAIVDEVKKTFDAVDVTPPEQTMLATDAQKRMLNVLVGKLTTGEHITKESLYDAVATKLRGTGKRDLVLSLDGSIDDEGVYHWSPLRESLSRVEANQLIDWLVIKQTRVEKQGTLV